MLLCHVTPERYNKTFRIMAALAKGWPDARVALHEPGPGEPFVVWGQEWASERIIPAAHAAGTPHWLVDNGYHMPARGTPFGFHRITYRGLATVLLPDPPMNRLQKAPSPWRRGGKHILIAAPGGKFGAPYGIKLKGWEEEVAERLRSHTDRPIVIRRKGTNRPPLKDMAGAHAVVTYASALAVDAVMAGFPVFCSPLCGAAPVSCTDLSQIETPVYHPGRAEWWSSLMCQQFTIAEMAQGTAYRWLRQVREYIEENPDDRLIRPESCDRLGFGPLSPL